jgi:hypothetical protein
MSLRWRFVPAFFWPFGTALASAEIFRQARWYVAAAGAALIVVHTRETPGEGIEKVSRHSAACQRVAQSAAR